MDEFAFELSLCTTLEASTDAIVARQIGVGGRHDSGRVLDIVLIEPGPAFDTRVALTPHAVPELLLESDIGAGTFRDWRRELGDGIAAERAIDIGLDIGVLERDHRRGREMVKFVDRYPDDWFDRIVAIENKPDLSNPGDLYHQLQFDTSLGVVDEVVLATASHVTRAHRHRLPETVGIWRFDPTAQERSVLKPASQLPTTDHGIEIRDRHTGRIDITPIDPETKAASRRRLAERAFGKGWRTYALPGCANLDRDRAAVDGIPRCEAFDRIVDPAIDCGSHCPDHAPIPPPAIDLTELRDERSPWNATPPTRRSRQSTLADDWTN